MKGTKVAKCGEVEARGTWKTKARTQTRKAANSDHHVASTCLHVGEGNGLGTEIY